MKLQYYGTAAAEGWPGLFCKCQVCQEARRRGGKNIRTRAQACIDDRLLLDFGPDTYLHTIYGNLKLEQIHSCLITHSHEDHLCISEIGYRAHGYAGQVIPERFMFYGSRTVCDILDHMPSWENDPERIGFQPVDPYQTFEVEGYQVTPLIASHALDDTPPMICYIYAIEKTVNAFSMHMIQVIFRKKPGNGWKGVLLILSVWTVPHWHIVKAVLTWALKMFWK
ncbi:MAG: hypothetical protein IJI38_11265 [Clostridia bacterium]|nr:hypothetical protein [Clostridia bacterium]